MNTIGNDNPIRYEIVDRQLAMKDSRERSWFSFERSIPEINNMSSINTLFENLL